MLIFLHCYLWNHLLGSQVEVYSLYFVGMFALETAFNEKKEALKQKVLPSRRQGWLQTHLLESVTLNALSRHCQTQKRSDIHALLCAPASLVHITLEWR